MQSKDVRIATYLTTYNGKNTSITFYDGKEVLLDSSRVKLEIKDDKLWFIPDRNGYSVRSSRVQFSTRNLPRVQDGEYELKYNSEKNLYFVDFAEKSEITINEGSRRGMPQNNRAISTYDRKKKDDKVTPVPEETKNWADRYNDMIVQNNSKVAIESNEEIVKAFLNAGLDAAIESEDMDDIKAYHRILKKL